MKEINAIITQIKAKARGRATAFVIGNTADLFAKGRFYTTPLRDTDSLVYGGVIVRDVKTARAVATFVDGKVDYIFVDDEKKIRKIYYGPNDVGNIEKELRAIIKRSTILTYKGNDITVEAIDALVCTLKPEISGAHIAVIGMGNLGSKVALKLVERGVHVSVYRRDQKKLRTIAQGLNSIKSVDTISEITPHKSIASACRGSDMIIATTNEKQVVDEKMVRLAKSEALLIDAGKGCFTEQVAADPLHLIYRVDVSTIQRNLFPALIQTHIHFTKKLGRKYFPKLRVMLISTGLLALKNEIIVDDIENPQTIIGVSAGGGVLAKKTPQIEKKMSLLKKHFKIK